MGFSVLRNGLKIGYTAAKTNNLTDIGIFRKNIFWHINISNKSADKKVLQIREKCPKELQIRSYLLTKDAQAWKFIYMLLFRLGPKNGWLSVAERPGNNYIHCEKE